MIEAALGAVAGFVAGLYWGERGRRLDAQRIAGLRRPPAPARVVAESASLRTIGLEHMFDTDDRERMIRDTMAETGCSRHDAELDVDAMLGSGSGIGLSP